jgi:hypothetical protein
MDNVNEKQRQIDAASYEMYERTKQETLENLKSRLDPNTGQRMFTDEQIAERVALIESAQRDIVDNYVQNGGNPDDLKVVKKKNVKKKVKVEDMVMASMIEMNKEETEAPASKPKKPEKEINIESVTNKDVERIPKKTSFDSLETYDMIPLPSKGECYKTKTSKVPVSFLTAYDENLIIAPNLYRDNLIIDTILEQKVMSDEVAPKDMLEGDRDAIILFLRASGYGNEYPITVTDDRTGEDFDTVIDLTNIKYKPFKLKGDSNGYFEFELPYSKDVVKFRFLTHQNNLDLRKIEELEDLSQKKARLNQFVADMDEYIDHEEALDRATLVKTKEAIRTIEKWSDALKDEEMLYTHTVTNRLEMSVMAVNSITDREYIRKYVRQMNVKDSSALRKYINENEPGLDYNVEITRPESLGGGSMSAFLQFDQFIFLNVAQ